MTRVRPTTAIAATVVWGLGLFFSLLPLFMSVMMFDAPGSEENPWTWVIIGGFISLPILTSTSIATSWLTWFITRDWAAEKALRGRRLRLAAALYPLLGFLVVTFGFVMLQVKCGGSFSCR
ncbi:MAG: hypothetical protein ACOZQL_16450 [Myxococcota bacterium]